MATRERQILAMGGGGFLMEPGNPALDDYALGLTRASTPRVCFVSTASGDNPDAIERFYRSFPPGRARASHLALFRMETSRGKLADVIMNQDLIYVGGGNTANMLAVWRLHGIDRALRRAWNAGVVLAGVSAGMLCWFQDGVTDSFGRPLHALGDGLGFLPGSACPHFDGEGDRRGIYHRLLGRGMAGGYAADDGCGLHFVDRRLHKVVASRDGATGYRLKVVGGRVVEVKLPAQRL